LEELYAFSVYQNEERSHDIMLSVWLPALHFVALCTLSSDAYNSLGAAKTCTQRAETRPALPSLRRQVDAGHLAVRDCPVPLSHTRLCHRRTVGGQGVEKKTNNGADTARECEPTPRVSCVSDGYQCFGGVWK